MQEILKKVFSPILNIFEKGDGPYSYRPSHRKILFAVGALFLFLAVVSLYFSSLVGGVGALIPALVFFVATLVCFVVGALGSERAVARIWGSK